MKRVFRVLGTAMFGHDVFVSYARSDGSVYATRIQDGLEQASLWTFVDYKNIPPGERLTKTLRRAVRKSRLLVVICSAAAVRSKWVALEIETFPSRRRKVVPIDIAGRFASASWHLDTKDVVWIPEDEAALEAGVPSKGVVEGIVAQINHRRRRTRAMQVAAAALFAIGIALATARNDWSGLNARA